MSGPQRGMDARTASTVYSQFFRRSSTWFAGVFGVAIVGELVFDGALSGVWRQLNRGKLWVDVERALPAKSDDDE